MKSSYKDGKHAKEIRAISQMRHITTKRFWKLAAALPRQVQETAKRNVVLLNEGVKLPSIQLKKLRGEKNRWAMRVGRKHRARGEELDDGIIRWDWIGSHGGYDRKNK